jgi:hypothetical protein
MMMNNEEPTTPVDDSQEPVFEPKPFEPEPTPELKAEKPKKADKPVQPKQRRFTLRWVLVRLILMLIFFALGVMATWWVLVRPMQVEVNAVRATATAQFEMIEEQMSQGDARASLLNALADVSSALVELGQSNTAGARAALAGTDNRLASLEGLVAEDAVEAVQGMRQQLSTALDALDDSPDEALTELNNLARSILALERSLYDE